MYIVQFYDVDYSTTETFEYSNISEALDKVAELIKEGGEEYVTLLKQIDFTARVIVEI